MYKKLSYILIICCTIVTYNIAKATNYSQISDIAIPEGHTGWNDKHVSIADNFMVVTANPEATRAGYEILKKGGNAVDAAVAIQATLGLTEPQSSGLGGGAFVVYWDNKKKKLTTFDGREVAPRAANEKLFLDEEGNPLKFLDAVVGGRSVGVPGVPKLLEDMHKRYGSLQWDSLFQVPLELSTNGFVVSPRLAKLIEDNIEILSKYPTTREYFIPNGKPLKVGDLVKNPDYARTLEKFAKDGSKVFYKGNIAKDIIKVVQEAQDNSGLLTLKDLKRYKVIERKPICIDYRSYDVCGMGPPSSGALAIGQILGILNNYDLASLGVNNPESWRLIGEASRLAFADRGLYVADPKFVKVPVKEMLDVNYLNARSNLIKNQEKALKTIVAGNPYDKKQYASDTSNEAPSTTHFSIVDSQGNVLSATSSIERGFGSTLMSNGFLLNNQLTDFSFVAEKDGKPVANKVEAGKSPRSSMSPTIVLKDNKPYMAIGSPGGSFIIGYTVKAIIGHIDWGLNMQEAINLPNLINRFGVYDIEEGMSASRILLPHLTNMGYETKIRPLTSGLSGIIIKKNKLEAGADPRRENYAMGE